jgi:single-strand DNA-binding protein
MNKAFIIGNLTKDPEVRATGTGISVCTFTVAVQRRFQNAQGERQADFIPVVCWRGLADNCGKYLHKGSKAGVIGSVQTRSYDAADGTKRYVTEVVADEVEFLERPQHGETRPGFAGEIAENESTALMNEDDLPF